MIINNDLHPDFSLYKPDKKNELLKQKPISVWMTGLSGSGKSTIAKELEKRLLDNKYFSCILDGDNIRYTINKDLGFSEKDRTENIRRVAELNSLLLNNGIIVINCFISPAEKDRDMIKEIIGKNSFFEIHIDCPLVVCIERDVKGLYKKALSNKISNFAGIHYKYEEPLLPFLKIRTDEKTVEQCVLMIYEHIINYIKP
ncbi:MULTISPECIES: adenylyl-sulfate kinase [unclassified Chryseobacterium]|uniref:adenylyl-sulfate kinase n=1 Tax=unclassified Chryseobacterium TaxID=2593645 RepID=UPI000F45CD50|nr:adenylyl-sulfate kinase [Chryseobacterium sp. G0240]ROI04072.1 adenylyl-sulfate kinase [Chryseobacterium sp. G0240]